MDADWRTAMPLNRLRATAAVAGLVGCIALLRPGVAETTSITVMQQRPYEGRNVELVSQIGGAALRLAVSGTTAYMGLGPRLAVVDLSNPREPRLVGTSELLGPVV